MLWLESLWHFVFGWPSLAILIGVAATAIAILEPPWLDKFIPNVRTVAIATAVVAFSFTAIAGKYYDDGLTEKQRQWSASLAKEAKQGETAGEDADRTVQSDTPDRVRNDRWNRDNWKLRGSQ